MILLLFFKRYLESKLCFFLLWNQSNANAQTSLVERKKVAVVIIMVDNEVRKNSIHLSSRNEEKL